MKRTVFHFVLSWQDLHFGAVFALMNVLKLMAGRASQRHAFVFLVGVAGGAGHLLMPARQREFGLRVVERAHFGPALLAVAALAVIAEAALMLVVGLVAADALAGRVPELHIRLVAAVASGLLVAANKREIRQGVIEGFLVELHDVGGAALMVGMADVAIGLGSVRPLAVQAASQFPVTGNVLMAGKAKPGLRALRERLVAIRALLFELRMPLHQLAWHDELLENALSVRRPGRSQDKEGHGPKAQEGSGFSQRRALMRSCVEMDRDHMQDRRQHEQEEKRHMQHMPKVEHAIVHAEPRGLVDGGEIDRKMPLDEIELLAARLPSPAVPLAFRFDRRLHLLQQASALGFASASRGRRTPKDWK